MKKFKKLTAGLLGVVMAMSVCSFTAFAEEDDKYAEGAKIKISSDAELVKAINNQKDGQTWILEDGNYNVFNTESEDELYDFSIKSDPDKDPQTDFVFPITANNLTIKGANGSKSNVTITSSYVAPENTGGNWHLQNFITISGSNVTIKDVDLKANRSEYYGTCNKAIELVDTGKGLKIENVEILPLKNSEGGLFSGSIYYNVTDAGESVLDNVTLYSWVSASKISKGTLEVSDLVQDFRNNEYEGYSYQGNYSWNPGITGNEENVEIDGFVVKVDNKIKLDKQLFNSIDLRDGMTIELENGTYKVDETLQLNKDVVINGNGSTIEFTNEIYDNEDKSERCGFNITGGTSEINDLTIEGNKKIKHGINVYTGAGQERTTVVLDGVTMKDGKKGYGLVNNASDVTVKNIETSGNDWGGINVDNADGAGTDGAKFTMVSGTINEEYSIAFENKTGAPIDAEIKDGTFKGYVGYGINDDSFGEDVDPKETVDVSIKNGTFKTDVSDFRDDDSHLVKDDDDNFVIMDDERYEDYLDSKRPTHSYELEEGRVERDDEEDEKDEPVVTPEEEAGPFSDVGKDNPNYDAIIKVYENGWMAGIGDGVFAPNGTLTRAMGATVLWNKAGKPEPQNVAPFLDVTGDAWYAKAVAWTYEQGIIAGYDATTFAPDDALTTEQFTRMNDIANGKTPEIYVGGAPNATRGWVASLLAM